MTRPPRATIAGLVLAASALLPATSADAHSTSTYCGLNSTGTIHEHHFVYAWTDSRGRHRHLVQLTHPWGDPHYANPFCPGHKAHR